MESFPFAGLTIISNQLLTTFLTNHSKFQAGVLLFGLIEIEFQNFHSFFSFSPAEQDITVDFPVKYLSVAGRSHEMQSE